MPKTMPLRSEHRSATIHTEGTPPPLPPDPPPLGGGRYIYDSAVIVLSFQGSDEELDKRSSDGELPALVDISQSSAKSCRTSTVDGIGGEGGLVTTKSSPSLVPIQPEHSPKPAKSKSTTQMDHTEMEGNQFFSNFIIIL